MRSLALPFSLLAILLVAGIGCATSSPAVSSAESPKGPVELTLNAKNDTARLVFGDSKYKIHLRKINDSRCPANAKCVWAGELAAEFQADRDMSGYKESKRITLGEATVPSITIIGATFELMSISETSVTFRVTPE